MVPHVDRGGQAVDARQPLVGPAGKRRKLPVKPPGQVQPDVPVGHDPDQQATILEFYINRKKWDSLSDQHKASLESGCGELTAKAGTSDRLKL